jgi:hypothetical protein
MQEESKPVSQRMDKRRGGGRRESCDCQLCNNTRAEEEGRKGRREEQEFGNWKREREKGSQMVEGRSLKRKPAAGQASGPRVSQPENAIELPATVYLVSLLYLLCSALLQR